MCVMSMVIDSKTDDWSRRYWRSGMPIVPLPEPAWNPVIPLPTQQEVDEFRRLLARAREYDLANNQPECPEDQKRELLQRMAEQLGVEISFP